jgi:hypothetical protein
MPFNELMDYTSMKLIASGNPILLAEHHNFMAANFGIIRDGLRSFSLANNTNHNQFNDYHFEGLAYEGVHESSYYLNNVIKNPEGTTKMIDFFGTSTALNTVYVNLNTRIQEDSSIPCN